MCIVQFQICETCVLQVTNIEFTSKWCHLQNLDKTESRPEDRPTILKESGCCIIHFGIGFALHGTFKQNHERWPNPCNWVRWGNLNAQWIWWRKAAEKVKLACSPVQSLLALRAEPTNLPPISGVWIQSLLTLGQSQQTCTRLWNMHTRFFHSE